MKMDTLSYEVSSDPFVQALLSSGGAAGAGGDVVSEGQAYGILASAIAIASMNEGDMYYEAATTQFSGYFNGWRKMAENSMGHCQNPKYCNG
jgi:hypothetical protein